MQNNYSVDSSVNLFVEILDWWSYTMTLPISEMALSLFNAILVILFLAIFFLGVWWVGCWVTNDIFYSTRRTIKRTQEKEEQLAREIIAERIRRRQKSDFSED